MGWKSTIDISRENAIKLIESIDFDKLSNDEISSMLESIYGDNIDRPYFGYNFSVIDDVV